ncbi:MAG: DinB family protein [Chloroflexia bacterium]
MDNKANDLIKPKVLALVAQGEKEQREFIAQLSEAERAAIGAPNAWAAKDHIAHNTAWIADAARVIGAATRGETPEPSPEDAEYNPQVFAAKQHQPWEEIVAEAEQANEAARAAIEACSEEDLSERGRFEWRKGRPLWYEAYSSIYEHPAEHWAQYYLETGDVKRAQAVRQAAVDTARTLIEVTDPFGFMVYNLGAFYAKTGEPDLAFASIREALERVPRLREWSREDPDLESLRDKPDFQALVADPAEASTPDN